MRDNIDRIFLVMLIISILLYTITSIIYWFKNPELTQMQVFLEYWYWFVSNIIGGLICFLSNKSK